MDQNANQNQVSNTSLRVFGFIWCFIFAIFGFIYDYNPILFGLSFCFLLSACLFPRIYLNMRLYQIWIKLGNIIGNVNSRIIIFLLFYFMFVPLGLALKIIGKDSLKKALDKNVKSYFEDRKRDPGPMNKQY